MPVFSRPCDLLPENVPGQTVRRYPVREEPTRLRHALEDRHLVPGLPQVVGGGKSRRPGTYDRHPLCRLLPGRSVEFIEGLKDMISNEPLDLPDGDRLIELASRALVFTRVRADPSRYRREGVRLQHYLGRCRHVARTDLGQIGGHVDIGQTASGAGRGPHPRRSEDRVVSRVAGQRVAGLAALFGGSRTGCPGPSSTSSGCSDRCFRRPSPSPGYEGKPSCGRLRPARGSRV